MSQRLNGYAAPHHSCKYRWLQARDLNPQFDICRVNVEGQVSVCKAGVRANFADDYAAIARTCKPFRNTRP